MQAFAAFTYANAQWNSRCRALCIELRRGHVGTRGTSDRQDGPLEMHGKQSGNAQRVSNARPVSTRRSRAEGRSCDHFGTGLSSVTHRQKFPRFSHARPRSLTEYTRQLCVIHGESSRPGMSTVIYTLASVTRRNSPNCARFASSFVLFYPIEPRLFSWTLEVVKSRQYY